MSRPQFDAVFASGKKVVNRQLVAWIAPAEGPRSRLGLSVSRKVGDAPRRNRVKRCLRAAFRELSPDLGQPLDMVVLARPMAPPTSLATARDALAHLLRVHARRSRSA